MDEIRKLGDPVLKLPTKPIEVFNEVVDDLSLRMMNIMYANGGVGLAAPQVGISRSIFVYDDDQGNRGVVCNPTLTFMGDFEEVTEGCLSVPPYRFQVPRCNSVLLRGHNIYGSTISIKAQGFLAQIFQHETDHLNGKLYISYLPLKVQRTIVVT